MFSKEKYLNRMLQRRNNHLIKIITGARRVGKSFLMNNIFYNSLLNNGFDKNHIIKFAFDNADDQDKLDKYYPELQTRIYYKKDKYYINSKKFRAYINDCIIDDKEYILLLDEIQILEDFISTLNSYVGKENLDVYVTGSNSELLSTDIDTKFRGRGSVIHVMPLSFKEFNENSSLTNDEAYSLYFAYGGIPLVALFNNNEEKLEKLKSITNEIYLKDIVDRYGIRNVSDLEDLFKFLASSIGSTISPTKLVNTFKSVKNKSICDETLTSYIKCFENSFVTKIAKVYNIKGKKYINSPYKVYFEDIGIRNTILQSCGNDTGPILENIIFNDLRYKGYNVSVGRLSYSEKNKNNELIKIDSEIDFIAEKEFDKYYIQVCLNSFDEDTFNREIKSLNKINDSFKKIPIVKDGLLNRTTSTGIRIVDVYNLLNDDDLVSL